MYLQHINQYNYSSIPITNQPVPASHTNTYMHMNTYTSTSDRPGLDNLPWPSASLPFHFTDAWMGEKGGKNEALGGGGGHCGGGTERGVCGVGGGEGVLGSIVMMESNSILLHAEYSPGGLFPLPEHSRMVESFSLAQAA